MSPAQTSTLYVVFIQLLEHRTSKIYVLAVATVLPNHMLTGYALCTPVLGQFRAWVGFFGRLRRRRFHLPSRSANFPVGTFVYSPPPPCWGLLVCCSSVVQSR
eukprot:scaffold4846_cov99-Isochrysis_galbana.AAC.3